MFRQIGSFFKALTARPVRAAVTGVTTAATVSAAVFISMAAETGAPMTAQFEGTVLENYIDSVGIETWCIGETQVGRLEKGYTKEYCEALFFARFPQYAARLYSCYSEQDKRFVTPAMHAAFTDVYYNTGARCNTGMMRALRAKQPVAACEFILEYKNAGGKNCSVRKNNCFGVWDRRLKVLPICLADARKLPPEGVGP